MNIHDFIDKFSCCHVCKAVLSYPKIQYYILEKNIPSSRYSCKDIGYEYSIDPRYEHLCVSYYNNRLRVQTKINELWRTIDIYDDCFVVWTGPVSKIELPLYKLEKIIFNMDSFYQKILLLQ